MLKLANRGAIALILSLLLSAAWAQQAPPADPPASARRPVPPPVPVSSLAPALQAELAAAGDRAAQLILANDWLALRQLSQPFIDAHPEIAAPYGWRGLANLNLLQPRAAMPDLLYMTNNYRDVGMHWFNLGNALVQLNDIDSAVKIFETAARLDPANDLMWAALWDALDRKGDDARVERFRKQLGPDIAKQKSEGKSGALGLAEINTSGSELWPVAARSAVLAAKPPAAVAAASAEAVAPALLESIARGVRAWEAGRLEEAVATLEPALRDLTAKHGRFHPQAQRATDVLAIAFAEQMRPEAALGLISPSLQLDGAVQLARDNLARRVLQSGAESRQAVAAELALAYLLGANRDLREMVTHAVSVQEKAPRVFGPDALETQWAGAMFALALTERGQFQEGAEFAEALLKRAAPLYDKNPYLKNAIEGEIAIAYQNANRPAQALPHLEAALAGNRRVLGDAHRVTLDNFSQLSLALSLTGAAPRALALQDEALAIVRRAYGAGSPEEMHLQTIRAVALLRIGKVDDATQTLRDVLAWAEERAGTKSSYAKTAKSLLFVIYTQQGKRGAGARIFREIAPQLDEEVSRVEGGDAASIQRFAPASAIYKLYANSVLFRDPVQSFNVTESAKARTLMESTALSAASRGGLLPPEEQAQLDRRNGELAAADAGVAATLPASREHGEFELARLKAQAALNEFLGSLKQRYPKFRESVDVRSVSAPDGIGLLEQGTVFLSYAVSGKDLFGYGLSREHGLQAVWLGAIEDLPARVEAVRQQLNPELSADSTYNYKNEKLQDLSRLLLDPFAVTLRGAKRVLVSPDGPLAFLPFEILSYQGEPLISRLDVAYTPSLSVYALTRERAREYAQVPRKTLLSMGGAPYEAVAGTAAGSDPRGKRGGALQPRARGDDRLAALGGARAAGASDGDAAPGQGLAGSGIQSAFRLLNVRLPNLPGTVEEVKSVAQVFPPGEVKLEMGDAASESTLRQLNASGELAGFRYLHFAAHGYFDPEEPALSAIVLKQVGNPPGVDGFVTAVEWPTYNLKSDLIVMSACETGVGRYVDGSGVTGLPYALYVAGNTSLVLTLWQIADEPTQKFMLSFFTKLNAGMSRNAALSQTKREFLHDPKFSHPSLWAAFVFYGA